MNNSQQRQFYYYITYNPQEGLGFWENGASAISGIIGSAFNFFSVKKQMETQLQITRENNTTQKYIADKNAEMVQEQLDFQRELAKKQEETKNIEMMISVLSYRNVMIQNYNAIVVDTCRNIIAPNIRYILTKHGTTANMLSDLYTKFKGVQTMLETLTHKHNISFDSDYINNQIRMLDFNEAKNLYEKYYKVYSSNLPYAQSIIKIVTNMDTDEALYFLLALYLFEKSNYFFGKFSTNFNQNKRITEITVVNNPTIDIQATRKQYYKNLYKQEWDNELANYIKSLNNTNNNVQTTPSYNGGGGFRR